MESSNDSLAALSHCTIFFFQQHFIKLNLEFLSDFDFSPMYDNQNSGIRNKGMFCS